MRIRSVKPEFFKDRVTGRWSPEMKILYVGLWCFADDDGRFEWEPDLIRCELFPYHPDVDVEYLLEQIEQSGRIKRYRVGEQIVCVIPSFKKHQSPRTKIASKLPDPASGQPLCQDGTSDVPNTVAGEEGRGEEQEGNTRSPEARVKGDARHKPTVDLFFNLWAQLRGGKYRVQAKDTVGVARLLRDEPAVSLAEIERRMRLAFANPWFRQNGNLAIFTSQWSNYDRVVGFPGGAVSKPRPRVVGVDDNGQPIFSENA